MPLVPPHPRGWSPPPVVEGVSQSGSPAPAGMVPVPVADRTGQGGFPRTRGDGPLAGVYLRYVGVVPPHPRGWSRLHRRLPQRGPGSPAPAGMVPDLSPLARRSRRFPRTRGDGPDETALAGHRAGVPPYPRGWSRKGSGCARHYPGSPAPAGMVPGWIGSVDLGPRFPRTRGDGPGAVHVGDNGGAVPPHPRGWSLLAELRTTLNRGSPAPAGMVPSSPLIDTGYVRFPRTRGDGPTTRLPRYVGIVVPPHPRGWSPYLRSAFRSPPGSPAPAGMVPSRCSTKASPRWFPRTRGDGPGGAGRGPGGVEVPPHPRGWSLKSNPPCARLHGSPAPAGMVPGLCLGCQEFRRFPRTRGDGP